jgi:hypothetical protein
LDEIQTKVLRVFLLALQSHLSALPCNLYFFKLTRPLAVNTVQLLCIVKENGGKPDRKPYPFHGLRNPYRNLKSENSQDYAKNLNEIVRSFGFRLIHGFSLIFSHNT